MYIFYILQKLTAGYIFVHFNLNIFYLKMLSFFRGKFKVLGYKVFFWREMLNKSSCFQSNRDYDLT